MISLFLSAMLLLGTAVYYVFTTWTKKGIRSLSEKELIPSKDLPAVSIIVPARNEGINIEETLQSLAHQDYPSKKFEVIMVNDRSTDNTSDIMTAHALKYANFIQVNIDELPQGISPKKNAVEWGVAASHGEIVVTTDADCVHSEKWLHSLVSYFEPDVGMVAGFVVLEPDDESWIHKLHALDYISHTLVGAGAIGNGSAMNCTAANLAYRYQTFIELGGFGEHIKIVSGDDEFFLHRVVNAKKWKVRYAIGADSIVRSLPPESIKGVINQRLRWGSKGVHYPSKVKNLAIAIFLFLTLMMISPLLVLLKVLPLEIFIVAVLMKFYSDITVILQGSKKFGFRFYLLRFLTLFLIHPLEIVLSAFGGHAFHFNWKGVSYRSKLS